VFGGVIEHLAKRYEGHWNSLKGKRSVAGVRLAAA